MGYQPGQGAGSTGATATPGSTGNTSGPKFTHQPAPGAGKKERSATNMPLYYADIKGRDGKTRAQTHSGKYLFNQLDQMMRDGNTEDIRRLQEQLYEAGFYGNVSTTKIRWGDGYDKTTREALGEAITSISSLQSRGTRGTFFDVLASQGNYASDYTLGAGSTRNAPVFSYEAPDPAKIKATIDQAVPELLGQKLSPEETTMLSNEITSRLTAAARADFDAQQRGGVSTAFDPEAYIEQRAKELHPDQYGATQRADVAEMFLKILREPAPQTQAAF